MICAMACQPPTGIELRAAWEAMRRRRSLRHWPHTFDEVMADPLRSRCVTVEAIASRTRARQQAEARAVCGTAPTWPRLRPVAAPQIDLKRAAAGERDED